MRTSYLSLLRARSHTQENDEWRFVNYNPSKIFLRFLGGIQRMMTPKFRKEIELKSVFKEMKEVRDRRRTQK